MSKRPKVRVVTPIGTTRYAWLNTPDSKFDEPTYKTDLVVPEEEMQDLIEKGEEIIENFYNAVVEELKSKGKGAKAKKVTKLDPFIYEEDPESGDPTGNIIIRAKLKQHVQPKNGKPFKQAPELIDAFKKPIPPEVLIYSGSTGRLGLELIPYFSPKDGEVGLTKRLKVFQLKELKKGGGFDMDELDDGFDVEGDAPFDSDDNQFPSDSDDTDDSDNFY